MCTVGQWCDAWEDRALLGSNGSFNTPTLGVRVRARVLVKGAVLAGAGPSDLVKRRSQSVLNSDDVQKVRGPPTHDSGITMRRCVLMLQIKAV